jgi:hypothetical protein
MMTRSADPTARRNAPLEPGHLLLCAHQLVLRLCRKDRLL